MSFGGIFLIILAVCVPLYVGGGCLYNRKQKGTTGFDSMPNAGFWRDLPSLVKEGGGFAVGKVTGKGGGGGGNSIPDAIPAENPYAAMGDDKAAEDTVATTSGYGATETST
jgi:hypothetical protein